MGVVYKATDIRLTNRLCVVKEISFAQIPHQNRNWVISAFKEDALTLTTLVHPGIAVATDFFCLKDNWYLVMEFVKGETLVQKLEHCGGNPLPFLEVIDLGVQLCDVLSYMHNHHPPIIFRALKPSNVMVTPYGQVKLIGFGITRLLKPGRHNNISGYASPEQYSSNQIDERADVYALGALLHYLLTVRDPQMKPFFFPPVRQLNHYVPQHIEIAIEIAVQSNRDKRFKSIQNMRDALYTEFDKRAMKYA